MNLRRTFAVSGMLGAALAMPGTASAAPPSWAPAASATIHPGVETTSSSGGCTGNFIFFDGAGNVYLGVAAHCVDANGSTAQGRCAKDGAQPLPLGSPVMIQGASKPGTLAYSSALAMQQLGTSDASLCMFNDFALIKIDPADVSKVNPSVPVWGGPVGVGPAAPGSQIYAYVNSSLRLGVSALEPMKGTVDSVTSDGRGYGVHFGSGPAISGDSGSGVMNAQGQAMADLQFLIINGASTNLVGDLGLELSYLAAHAPIPGLQLADGTEPFNPNAATVLPA